MQCDVKLKDIRILHYGNLTHDDIFEKAQTYSKIKTHVYNARITAITLLLNTQALARLNQKQTDSSSGGNFEQAVLTRHIAT